MDSPVAIGTITEVITDLTMKADTLETQVVTTEEMAVVETQVVTIEEMTVVILTEEVMVTIEVAATVVVLKAIMMVGKSC
mmetsp:Transcript_31961/g.47175  ORF Transcript_31961/g.47175 Transcript_31961/m.47175 type:complete len:80 (+) Transcript_31961:2435-2674(+)